MVAERILCEKFAMFSFYKSNENEMDNEIDVDKINFQIHIYQNERL